MAVCLKGTMPIDAGNQITIIQKYGYNKNLPNLVSTVIIRHTVISQYPFTCAD